MKITISFNHKEPNLRELFIVIDENPWYQALVNNLDGYHTEMQINGDVLEVNIGVTPQDLNISELRQQVIDLKTKLRQRISPI